jgi:hypothetical protein
VIDWSNEIGAISSHKKFGTIAQNLVNTYKILTIVGAEGFVFISWSITTYALLSLEPMPNILEWSDSVNSQISLSSGYAKFIGLPKGLTGQFS